MVQECTRNLGRRCIAQRYVLAIMGFLAVANAYTMRVVLSVAITEMVKPTTLNDAEGSEDVSVCGKRDNSTTNDKGDFEWTSKQQGLILSSFFWGYVITHLPGGMLAERFGGKYTLGLGILSTAVFTLITPIVAKTGGWKWLLVVRIVEGLGEGTTFPALNALLAAWVPKTERSRLGSLVFAGAQIGTVSGTFFGGLLLAHTTSWDSVFYLFGGLGVVWFIIWTLICYSDPSSHPYITEEEKKYLEETVGEVKKKDLPPVPWRHLMTSVPLWGLICAQVGHDWGFFTMVTDLPKYMSEIMNFKIAQNAVWSSLPYLCMWIMSTASSWVGDWMIKSNVMSITNVRKMFTAIASIGPAVGIIAASYARCDRTAVVILFTIAMTFMGTFYPGMKVNALDLSPNYAGTLMAIVNGIGALTGIITPYLVGALTPVGTLEEWRIVFWIVFAVMLGTNFVYMFTASGEVQPWNDVKSMRENEMKNDAEEHPKNVLPDRLTWNKQKETSE